MKLAKKILALVLALAMILGMTVTASAAFDSETITYKEAVEVMTLAGVIEGDKNGKFNPTATLTRAEAAKIIVYMLGMEDVSTEYKANFSDTKGHWAEQYINLAAGLGILAGVGNGKFNPQGTLTGYEWAKIILTAMGYDAEIEQLVGVNWEANTSKLVKQEGVTKFVSKFIGSAPVSREVACQMAFNMIDKYFISYQMKGGTTYYWTSQLAQGNECFARDLNLHKITGLTKDAWGRPSTTYYVESDAKTTWSSYAVNSSNFNALKDANVVFESTPVVTYTEAVTGCQLLQDLGYETSNFISTVEINTNDDVAANLYISGANDYVIDDLKHSDASEKCTADEYVLGAQGQLVEVYETSEDDEYYAVVVDTFLAQVTKVNAAKTDKTGHVIGASIEVTVYDKAGDKKVEDVVLSGATGYEKGDYILVQLGGTEFATAAKATANVNKPVATTYYPAGYNIVGEAKSVEAKQTKVIRNAKAHEVDGTKYMDAFQFNLDKAENNGTVKFAWFFDQYGNLIGADTIETVYNYGVITSLQMIYNEDAEDYLQASIVYADGTTATKQLIAEIDYAVAADITVDTFDATSKINGAKNYYNKVTSNSTNGYSDVLFRIEETEDGLVLEEVLPTTEATKLYKNMTKIGNAKVDDETIFLFRSGAGTTTSPYAYKAVVGNDELTTYGAATATYYTPAGETFAKYVYITSAEDVTVTDTQLVFVGQYAENSSLLKSAADGVKYFELYDVYDYESDWAEVELKIKNEAELEGVYTNAITKDTIANLVEDLAGKLVLVTTEDGYVTRIDTVTGDDCVTVDSGANVVKKVANAATKTGLADLVELSSTAKHDILVVTGGQEEETYDVEGATILLDGEEVDLSYLDDSELKYYGVKTVYIVVSAKYDDQVSQVILSTTNDNNATCTVDKHTTYTVTVNGNGFKTNVVKGTEITLSKANLSVANDPATGVKIDGVYYAYGSKYAVKKDVDIETGYCAVTLNATGTAVAVEYGTTISAVTAGFEVAVDGDYVTTAATPAINSTYIEKDDAVEVKGNVNFYDGYYQLAVYNTEDHGVSSLSTAYFGDKYYLKDGDKFVVENPSTTTGGSINDFGQISNTIIYSGLGYGEQNSTAELTMDAEHFYLYLAAADGKAYQLTVVSINGVELDK